MHETRLGQTPEGQTPPAPQSVQVTSTTIYARSPYRSLSRNKRLLDSLGLRIVLNFGYAKGREDELAWRTQGLSGVELGRYFVRHVAEDIYRTLELALSRSPQSGYEVIVHGLQVEGTVSSPNPDFGSVRQMVAEEIAKLAEAPPVFDVQQLGYETYRLSYVGTDRALALLEILGYTTVEYSQQAGEGLYERIYEPIQKGTGRPPIIVKFIDSPKTSLMDDPPLAPGAMPPPRRSPASVAPFPAYPK